MIIHPSPQIIDMELLRPIFEALDKQGMVYQDGDSITQNMGDISRLIVTIHNRILNNQPDEDQGVAELFSYDGLITLIYHSGTRLWAIKVLHKRDGFDVWYGVHVFCILDHTPIQNTYNVKNFTAALHTDRFI